MQHLTHRSVISALPIAGEHCSCKETLLCIIMQPFIALARTYLQDCRL